MPAAVATAVADCVAAEFDTMKVEALARWRRWCQAVANGKAPPSPADILNTAALLEIRDPGVAFDSDVQGLVKYGNAKRSLAKCEEARDAILAPYGGNVRNLEAAVDEAEQRAKALRAELDRWNDPPGVLMFASAMAVLEHKHPRVIEAQK